MAFEREDKNTHVNSYTFYIRDRGPLPAANDVKVDITIKEHVCFALQELPIMKSYDLYEDLPEKPTVKVYSLAEIVIEKLAALTDKARNEPRDLYDLWYLVTSAGISLDDVRNELDAKLRFRGRKLDGLADALTAKRERLERIWETRLSKQVIELPEFEGVFRTVHRAVRAAKL